MISNRRTIEVTDLGAGSKGGLKKARSVSKIAEISVKNAKYSRLLFRMVNYFQPATILELGTSLGLSTISLAIARSESKVFTIEGCLNTREIAIENFQEAGLNNIDSRLGDFKDVLPDVLKGLNSVDLVFFDGNHQKEPTLHYFELCLQKANNESVFIFDDIYWSAEMTEAWKIIKEHPKVTVTIDLYQMGIVFFRKEQVKQHFVIAY
jgi:predicted O-methyltransferase YrrM